MIIRYYGHAFFSLTLENGTTIAMDPYDEFYQYPRRRITADVVTMSHHHYDHDGVQAIINEHKAVDTAGMHLMDGFSIKGISTCHDHHAGARRGKNVFFVVEAEGLRIGHAGDLGHTLTEEQLAQIGKLDILMVQVGGHYTVDANEAAAVRKQLSPAVCIPMHFRTEYNPDMPVTPVEDFLTAVGETPVKMPLMRATTGDMSQRMPVAVLEIEKP